MWQLSNRQWGDGIQIQAQLSNTKWFYVCMLFSDAVGHWGLDWQQQPGLHRESACGRRCVEGGHLVTTGRLPRPMDSPALTTLDNVLFLLGNFSYPHSVSLRWLYIEGGKDYNDEFDDILSFDPVKEIWVTVGHMAQRRREHAVTSLSAEQTEDLLNFCY